MFYFPGIRHVILDESHAEFALKISRPPSISYLKLWMFTMTGLMPVRLLTENTNICAALKIGSLNFINSIEELIQEHFPTVFVFTFSFC